MIRAIAKKGASGGHVAIEILMFFILILAVTYPIFKNILTNQSAVVVNDSSSGMSAIDYLVASAGLTLLVVLIIVKVAKAMKSS